VKASIKIQTLPSSTSPSLTEALNDVHSLQVAGANWILNSCDPYWIHAQATKPIPCIYGDAKSKKTVVLFGDSNAGNWVPALDILFKAMGYRLALFGFIGCTTAPVPETATSQPGFPGQWQLCNTWHASLPAAVRAQKPIAIMEAASPWMTLDAQEVADWVPAMKSAFDQMTIGSPKTLRIELGTTPLFPAIMPTCLAANPTAIQKCGVNFSNPMSPYSLLLARDAKIASAAKAILLPSWQWLCYQHECSPLIKNFMVVVDRDHTSTPYVKYIEGALASSFAKKVKLP